MTLIDDDRPVPRKGHEIGEDLSALSVDELKFRISLLSDEIARIQKAIDAKSSSRSTAESLFKR